MTDRPLAERILALLASPKYQPVDKVGLARKLKLPTDDRSGLREKLGELEESGQIARLSKERYALPETAGIFQGTISFTERGAAFIRTERDDAPDLFVPPDQTGTAFPGDRVVVRVTAGGSRGRPGGARGERETARVIKVIERASETIVGTLQAKGHVHEVVADDTRFPQRIHVRMKDSEAKGQKPQPGWKVVVRLQPWASRTHPLEGTIVESLGPADGAGVDMLSIIRKHHLPLEFPADVQAEAEAISESVPASARTDREDLRSRPVFTIDPDDARDFDDAIEVETLPTGGWRLHVHIADVSHYVAPGTALDREAARRGNSVYLADRVIPMLPERLSNGVCSLQPRVDRLAFSAFIEFDPEARVRRARFGRSVIRSAQRYTYKEAFAVLQGPRGESRLSEHLHRAWDLASKLRARRFREGALDLDMPEVKVYLDATGRPTHLEKVVNDAAHQLIEEFMLAANDAVAHALKHRTIPTIYRIHENPDPERLNDFREFARTYGYRVGDVTQRAEIQRVLELARGRPEEQAIRVALLKSLKRAGYRQDPLGHYGLAKTNYAHFTSPIRRYADLVVHRSLAQMIRAVPAGRVKSTDMRAIALHLSGTERTAADAEKESVKLKKLEFFRDEVERGDRFQAMIMDVREFGVVVELPDFDVGGRVRMNDMGDDNFWFDPAQRTIVARRSRLTYKAGDRVEVQVAAVDLMRQQIDFRFFVPIVAKAPGPKSKPPAPKSRSSPPPQRRRRR